MELSYEQKRFFYENGYVRVPGVVPEVMVRAARKAINHSLGQQGMDPEKLVTYRSQSYCPEVQRSPEITDLINKTPAMALAESLVGPGKFPPVTAGQIALRFPGMQNPPSPPNPHLDGMYSPHNGVEQGKIQNFTMLVSVLLSEVTEPFSGNFTVWPKTHHLYEAYFREQGPEAILEGMPKVDLPEPLQLNGKPGDVVFVHYELGHTAAPNVSDAIRYAIFFRLSCQGHEERKREVLTDIWQEWDGMRDVIAAK